MELTQVSFNNNDKKVYANINPLVIINLKSIVALIVKVTKKGNIYVNSHFIDSMSEMMSIIAKELYEAKEDIENES